MGQVGRRLTQLCRNGPPIGLRGRTGRRRLANDYARGLPRARHLMARSVSRINSDEWAGRRRDKAKDSHAMPEPSSPQSVAATPEAAKSANYFGRIKKPTLRLAVDRALPWSYVCEQLKRDQTRRLLTRSPGRAQDGSPSWASTRLCSHRRRSTCKK